MTYKRNKQYRLPGYDYSGDGEYFVTICVNKRKPYLGEIENGEMILSNIGKIADRIWKEIANKFDNVKLDVYQVMPDHFHGILIIKPKYKSRNLINQIPTVFK